MDARGIILVMWHGAPGDSLRVRDALLAGFAPGEVRRRLAAPFWGIRAPEISFDLATRCAQFSPRRGAAVYSHTTAARLLGLPVPLEWELDLRLHVAFSRGHRAPFARDVIGHELALRPGDVVEHSGLLVTDPARTMRDLARMLTLPDLVAVGDAVLRQYPGSASRLALHAQVRGFRGRARFVEALALLDARAESPKESQLRVALVGAALPNLAVNVPLFDARGAFVARPDLKFVDYPVILEYEGDGHRTDKAQWRRDLERIASMEDLGNDVIRVSGNDAPLFTGAVARARTRLRHHGWRPS